jgi:hypothetical protein
MAICRYCQKNAGWFSNSHDACVQKANAERESPQDDLRQLELKIAKREEDCLRLVKTAESVAALCGTLVHLNQLPDQLKNLPRGGPNSRQSCVLPDSSYGYHFQDSSSPLQITIFHKRIEYSDNNWSNDWTQYWVIITWGSIEVLHGWPFFDDCPRQNVQLYTSGKWEFRLAELEGQANQIKQKHMREMEEQKRQQRIQELTGKARRYGL